MARSGPILIIEDDLDDQEIIAEVLKELKVKNEVIFYTNTVEAYDFLKFTSKPTFIIICDINLPGMNGLEFKKKIDADRELREKSIPFIFLSTTASKHTVTEAYTDMTIQGFFQKTNSMMDLHHALEVILNYWKLCRHPNSE